jgi:hypothetical protein
MKKILVAAVASLAFMGAAYAGTVEGVVQSVDTTSKTITLEDGTQVVAGADMAAESLDALKAGTKVKVTLDEGSTNATAVEVVE